MLCVYNNIKAHLRESFFYSTDSQVIQTVVLLIVYLNKIFMIVLCLIWIYSLTLTAEHEKLNIDV